MQLTRSTTRRPSRAVLALGAALIATATGVLSPSVASAEPGTAAEAMEQVRKAAQELTVSRRAGARGRGDRRRPAAGHRRRRGRGGSRAHSGAVDAYEPQLRAIAHTGYTGKTQSRVAAFLTSDSADRARPADDDAGPDRRAHQRGHRARRRRSGRGRRQAQAVADEAAATRRGRPRPSCRRSRPRSRSGSSRTRPTSPGSPPTSRPPSPPPSPAAALAVPSVGPAAAGPGQRGGHRRHRGARPGRRPLRVRCLGPDAFDCSGLTSYAYAAAGVALPHSSRAQSQLGRAGLPRRAPARRPRLLLLAGQPRRHLHRQRDDGARPHATVSRSR